VNGWQQDKQWSDRFLHQIKGILGQTLIGEPPAIEDQERNTDLMVLKMDAVRIGCRVRRFAQQRYVGEFTIRSGRPSGIKTELTKIIEGWGNYLFYGFADEQDARVEKWLIGDLNAFRIWFVRMTYAAGARQIPGTPKNNTDGSSGFQVFKVSAIPGFVIASDIPAWIQPRSR
jgi:hypothetical protein